MTDTVTMTINLGVTDEGTQKISLTIGNAYMALDGNQVSDLIAALAAERAKMEPVCPWQLPHDFERVSYSSDRSWFLSSDALGEVLLLQFHHPGYGQIRFGFSRDRYLEFRDGVNIRVAAMENQHQSQSAQ